MVNINILKEQVKEIIFSIILSIYRLYLGESLSVSQRFYFFLSYHAHFQKVTCQNPKTTIRDIELLSLSKHDKTDGMRLL